MKIDFILLLLFFLGIATTINAQINTPTNPTIPFGSNTEYQGAVLTPGNLPSGGTYGTSQDAANAYNTWKSNYVEACGTGKYRVKYDNPAETVSEGIAYGMILAAYAADKDLFDGLWQYYKDNMNGNGVMNWKINGCGGASGTGGAADAEVDAALGLLVANHQWPGSASPHDYAADAQSLITAIRNYEIQPAANNGTYQLNNGDQWGFWNDCRNPSYQPPAYFRLFGEFTGDMTFWNNCVAASYTLLNNNVHPTTGLVSNWSDHNGTPNTCNGPNEYGWDACRNPWRMLTDIAWFDAADAKAICDKMTDYVQGVGANQIAGPVAQSGGTGSYHAPTFISTFALGVMGSDASHQTLMDQMYAETVAVQDSPPWYFGNTLRCISLFAMTGNFWNPFAAPAVCEDIPTNVTADVPAQDRVSISWDAVPGATKYQVRHRLKGETEWQLYGTLTNSKTISGLTSGSLYEYRVRTLCANGIWSEYSTLQRYFLSTCDYPTNIAFSQYSNGDTKIEWDAAPDFNKYQIRYREVGGSAWSVSGTTPGNNFKRINFFNPGSTYEIRVRTSCVGDVWSQYSPIFSYTAPAAGSRLSSLPGNDISVFPNPAHEILHIEITSDDEMSGLIRIFDFQGRLVLEKGNHSWKGNIDITGLPSGKYILKYNFPEGKQITTTFEKR